MNPCIYSQLIFLAKAARAYIGGRNVSSENGAEKTGYPHAEGRN
jgi:hypothetical protein